MATEERRQIGEARRPGERFRRAQRLRRGREFEEAYREGIRVQVRFLVLVGRRNRIGQARLGISAGRRCGGAVARNRLKRRIRELFRHDQLLRSLSFDVVVNARPDAARASYVELAGDYGRASRNLRLRLGQC